MKNIIIVGKVLLTFFFTIVLLFVDLPEAVGNGWKAGVAREVITPQDNLWLAGFAARTRPAEGKLQDLWVKALAMEDSQGNKILIITTDIIGYSRELSHVVCNRLMEDLHLERKNILLSASHTHSSPVVNRNLFGIYPPFSEAMKARVEKYLGILQDRIVLCGEESFKNMRPATITSGVGIARFAVNRRNNRAEDVLYSPELAGPSDHSVPVIKVSKSGGDIMAIVFGYACHATTIMEYKYSGDYPGYAQAGLEKAFPGTTAMFFAGCGADQNGLPRGTVSLTEQYGNELAEAVKRVLKEPMKDLDPELSLSYNEIDLPFSDSPSIQELEEIAGNSSPWQQRWAKNLEKKIKAGESIPGSYPYYPVQAVKLGDQVLVALGGEVVSDYAFSLRKSLGNDIFIAAYSNDVMAYIPSEKVLKEGGYEGDFSMQAYGQPADWAPGIEGKILAEVNRQVKLLKPDGK